MSLGSEAVEDETLSLGGINYRHGRPRFIWKLRKLWKLKRRPLLADLTACLGITVGPVFTIICRRNPPAELSACSHRPSSSKVPKVKEVSALRPQRILPLALEQQ